MQLTIDHVCDTKIFCYDVSFKATHSCYHDNEIKPDSPRWSLDVGIERASMGFTKSPFFGNPSCRNRLNDLSRHICLKTFFQWAHKIAVIHPPHILFDLADTLWLIWLWGFQRPPFEWFITYFAIILCFDRYSFSNLGSTRIKDDFAVLLASALENLRGDSDGPRKYR